MTNFFMAMSGTSVATYMRGATAVGVSGKGVEPLA